MITSLSIVNFALIEKLSVDFSKGFTVITGETGAGKSILLGALGLLLGKRADLTSLKSKEEKCVVEASFNIKDYNLNSFFNENDLDYDDITIIRREILTSGKSRAFINDTPVNLSELQMLSFLLIDIHSQHQTNEIFSEEYQFQIIDAIASNNNLVKKFSEKLSLYKKLNKELISNKEKIASIQKEKDYNNHLLQELISANLKIDEQKELELKFENLNNVELIKQTLDKTLSIANDEQIGVISNLNEIKLSFQKISSYSSSYKLLYDRILSILIEFDDIEKELSGLSESVYSSPEELININDRLQLIYSLQKKHQVNSINELLLIQNDLDNKLISAASLEFEIAKIENEISILKSELDIIALEIHNNRVGSLPDLISKLTNILEKVGMANAKFDIKINSTEELFKNGKDEIQFLFSANKGSDFGLLKKVASGGEMSRIMLAIKSILSEFSKLPTIIFDEIDTGVSGEIASKMGEIMKTMSNNMQVFSITHLPQIASKGNEHFKVYKVISNEQTLSELKLLSHEERVIEIAQMLSGASISESALLHAKELLN